MLAVGPEQSELPVQRSAVDLYVAAQPGFARARDDLLQGRIGYQETFQQAGLRWIRAAQLEWGRGTVRFRISGIECHFRKDLVGQPDDRIETAEGVIAVDVRAGAEDVRYDDFGKVVTSARGQREPIGDVERFIGVEAVICILCIKIDRAEAQICGGMDDLSTRRDGGIWSDEQVGEDVAKLAVGLKIDLAVVDAAAEGEIIVVTEDLVVVGGLQGSPGCERVGESAVHRAPRRGGACVPAARWAIDGLVAGGENLEIRLRLGGESVVFQAQGVE